MDYLEAVVTCTSDSDCDQWFTDHGFNVTKMKAGLLIAGDRKEFEKTFDVDLGSIKHNVDLPIPEKLKERVSSIQIPRLDYF